MGCDYGGQRGICTRCGYSHKVRSTGGSPVQESAKKKRASRAEFFKSKAAGKPKATQGRFIDA